MSHGSCALCASPAVAVGDGVPLCARDAQLLGVPVEVAGRKEAAAVVHAAVVEHMTAYDEASRG